MGIAVDNETNDHDVPFRERRPDEFEWAYEREKLFDEKSDEEMRESMQLFSWETHDEGNALPKKDLRQLRTLLQADELKWPDERLARHTNEIAALIGFQLAVVPRKKMSEHREDIEHGLLAPAEKFLDTLNDPEFQFEFYRDWSSLNEDRRAALANDVEDYIGDLRKHIDTIRSFSTKGKQWDSPIKRDFVNFVAMFAEYVNYDFEPSRVVDRKEDGGALLDIVKILAKPLRWRDSPDVKIKFEAAVREHVDRWNAGKKRLIAEIEAKRDG